VQDRDLVGELLGLVEILGGEEHGGAAAGEVLDDLPHLEAALRVEAGGGLVEEDDLRVADEAHGDVEAAAHAAGVGGDPAAGRVDEAEPGKQAVGDLPRALHAPQLGDHDEVLPAGEDLVHRRELAGKADRVPDLRGLRRDVEPADGGGAAVGLEEGREDPDERGLPGAVGAEQREDGPARHVEFDAPEDVQVLVGLPQPADLYCRFHPLTPYW